MQSSNAKHLSIKLNFLCNRRESVNDLGYLTNYIPIAIEDGKDMRVELHPTALRIPPSHHERLSRPRRKALCETTHG
jgi:hypothetical protein